MALVGGVKCVKAAPRIEVLVVVSQMVQFVSFADNFHDGGIFSKGQGTIILSCMLLIASEGANFLEGFF